VREDLGARARTGRERRRRSLLAFAQLTDVHIIDAQSPARVEFADRYNDGPGSPLPFSAAYRPHEMLTAQVADSVIAAVERVGRGPAAGAPLSFVICTGDNVDNCQHNELRWQIDLMDGRTVRPDSGDLRRYEGVADQHPDSYDVHYWHPDGTPAGDEHDQLRAVHGFPVVPGLLDAARRPFRAHGVGRRWYTCYGNHDGLVQGNFPMSFQLETLAVGDLKVVGLAPGASFEDLAAGRLSPGLLAGPVRQVTPDASRRIVTRQQTVEEHFRTGGLPLGHGYTSQNVKNGTAYYTFECAPRVRGIVLDTVNPNGESSGSIDRAQLAWLESQLAAARNKLVIVFSHHTLDTMSNQIPVVDEPGERVLGQEVLAALQAHANVIAWVNGHTHENKVTPRRGPGGSGFWEISTAAHVDWPVQARLLEVLDNRDGTLSLFGTIVDAAAPLSHGGRLSSTSSLASLARELAANDPQEEAARREGGREDRNVELLVKAPFRL